LATARLVVARGLRWSSLLRLPQPSQNESNRVNFPRARRMGATLTVSLARFGQAGGLDSINSSWDLAHQLGALGMQTAKSFELSRLPLSRENHVSTGYCPLAA